MPVGSLKYLDYTYGFIKQNDGPDVFVHVKDAASCGVVLVPGMRLSFDVLQAPRGPRAINIALAP